MRFSWVCAYCGLSLRLAAPVRARKPVSRLTPKVRATELECCLIVFKLVVVAHHEGITVPDFSCN